MPHRKRLSSNKIILETHQVSKKFGGLTAVHAFDFFIHQGEICSLIGPNGAGKTTFFNVVTGIYKPEGGKIIFKGKDITGRKPHQIVAQGIARTFQNIRLFSSMTCLENIMAGQHCRTFTGVLAAIFRTPRQQREEKYIREIAEHRLEQVGLARFRDEPARNISYGNQRMLEIARALATDPDIIVLDEPSSGLNPRETEDLMVFLQKLIEEEEISILLIEHDMNIVMGISDWVTVMDEGTKIAEGRPEYIYNNPLVIEAYLGKDEEGQDREEKNDDETFA